MQALCAVCKLSLYLEEGMNVLLKPAQAYALGGDVLGLFGVIDGLVHRIGKGGVRERFAGLGHHRIRLRGVG